MFSTGTKACLPNGEFVAMLLVVGPRDRIDSFCPGIADENGLHGNPRGEGSHFKLD